MKRLRQKFNGFIAAHLALLIVLAVVVLSTVFLLVGTKSEDGSITLDGGNAKYTDAEEQAQCELRKQRGDAVRSLIATDIPQDAGSGCEPRDIAQMGASTYFKVDVSTPGAFVAAVNGRGFNEGYGYQCVAGFKQFMYALSGKYVATKTGGASGYAQQQAQIEPLGFKWHTGRAGLQDGDWAIFGGGQYGHVAMYYQGKWFGQNQGAANIYTGNPFSLLDLGSYADTIIGYYRPNIYVQAAPAPTPAPTPTPPTASSGSSSVILNNSYTTQRGDTLGGIALKNGWYSGGALFGDTGYTQRLAEQNGIEWRGLIYPGQVVEKLK